MSKRFLSGTVTAPPSVESPTPPSVSFPVEVQDKPHHYIIDGEEYGPESIFSYGERLKGNPYDRAKAYAWAESKYYAGAAVCEVAEKLGDEAHYVTYRTAEVHHRVRNDLHMAKTLGIACHSHNAVHGPPSVGSVSLSETVEKEKAGTAQPEASSLETAKHDPQRAAWDRIIEDGSLFKKLDDLNLMVLTSKGGKLYQAQDMAEAAVYLTIDKVFGKYSSETFMRYAREDRFGPLEMLKDGGRWWVRPKERHTQ